MTRKDQSKDSIWENEKKKKKEREREREREGKKPTID